MKFGQLIEHLKSRMCPLAFMLLGTSHLQPASSNIFSPKAMAYVWLWKTPNSHPPTQRPWGHTKLCEQGLAAYEVAVTAPKQNWCTFPGRLYKLWDSLLSGSWAYCLDEQTCEQGMEVQEIVKSEPPEYWKARDGLSLNHSPPRGRLQGQPWDASGTPRCRGEGGEAKWEHMVED